MFTSFFPFLHEIFHSPILQRECFLSIAHDYNKKDPARARGTQQLASLTGGVMRPEGYLPTRGGPGRNPSTFSAPPWILALEVPPPHSIIFHPGGDEQASDKDPSRIPFHSIASIHPSLDVSIFAAHCSITHRIGTGLLRPGVDNDAAPRRRRQPPTCIRPGGGPGTFAEWADDVVRYVGITPCVRR
jgi:hypothetical protein